VAIDELSLSGGAGDPLLSFDSLAVEVDRFDVFGSRLALGSVRWVNPRIPLVIDARGELPLLRFLPRSEPAQAPAPASGPSGKPFRVTAGSITLEGGTIPFTDRRFEPSFRKDVGPIAIGISDFDNTAGEAGLELTIGAGSGEHVTLSGKFSLAPKLVAAGTLAIKGVPVPAYAPYLKDMPAVIESATLGAGTDFEVTLNPRAPVELTTRNGWLKVASVTISRPGLRGARLTWERLGMDGLAFSLATRQATAARFGILKLSSRLPRHTESPPGRARLASLELGDLKAALDPLRVEAKTFDLRRFSVREKAGVDLILGFARFGMRGMVFDASSRRVTVSGIRLQAPELNLALEKSGGLNLARLLIGPPPPPPPDEKAGEKQAGEGEDEAKATASAVKTAPPAGPGMTLVLPRIALHRGNVRFVDQTVEPPFVGGMKDIEVDLRGLSTLPGTRASLSVKADAGTQGSIEIEGSASPNDSGLNPSVDLRISGTDLTTFSPYTLRYISHPVATGKLDLRVRMVVSGRKLEGENKVTMSNFTLGEERESPDDVGIPIGLALVLLRDSDNGIELDVPVSGNLDDPDFALGKVIWHAVTNVLTKIVTSPFTFLASLVGGGEDIDLIAMEPGLTRIQADSDGKIDLLIKALKKRPGVRLAIAAVTDPVTDGDALTRQRVELALEQQKSGGSEDGGPGVDPAERPLLVDRVARAVGWKSPEGEALPPEAIQRSQEAFLRKSLAAGPEQLRELGAARVEAILRAIRADPGVAPERLFVRQAGADDLEKASRIKRGVVIDIQ
jgi:hypothetical protein